MGAAGGVGPPPPPGSKTAEPKLKRLIRITRKVIENTTLNFFFKIFIE
ncbi:hypothetical protein ES705_45315 [subsurface metagenome]